MKKVRRILTMGLAVVAAVSAMSVSVLAAEADDVLVTTLYDLNNNPVEIYQSELEEHEVTVDTVDGTVTIGIPEVKSFALSNTFNANAATALSFSTSVPSTIKKISAGNSMTASYSLNMGASKYSPRICVPASGYSSINYTFTPDTTDKQCIIELVVYKNGNPIGTPVSVTYQGIYYALTGLTGNSTQTYVQLNNNGYAAGASGTCTVTN